MLDPDHELKIGTKVLADGTIGLAVFRGDENIGGKVMSQDDVASMAAHFLNAATAAQKKSHSLPAGAGHTVLPTGISLAQTDDGGTMVVLWFGQGGVSFPIEPTIARELFGAISEAYSAVRKH